MAMKEGPTDSIEYHDHNGDLHTVHIDTVSSGAFNTSDPEWIIDGYGKTGDLSYKNSSGDPYTAKIHCETLSGTGDQVVIRAWAGTKHNGKTEGDVKGILVTDSAGTPWAAELLQHKGQNLPVTFYLHPFPPPQGY